MDEAVHAFSQLWMWAKGWRAEVTAAWAQAILSAVAIIYSGRLAFNQVRGAKREKIDTYLAIFHSASEDARAALRKARAAAKQSDYLRAEPFGFAAFKERLDAIPFHDVPDHRLIELIRNASEAVHMLDRNFDQRIDSILEMDGKTLDRVEEAASTLIMCFMDARTISYELGPLVERWHLKILGSATLHLRWLRSRKD